MRAILAVSILVSLAACAGDDGGTDPASPPWTVDCEYGAVTRLEPDGPEILMTCDNGCSDEVKRFDTYDDYQRFDPATLCL